VKTISNAEEILKKLFLELGDFRWLNALCGAAVGFLFPVPALLTGAMGVMLVIALDTFTGIRAARRRGEPISSSKLRGLVDKLIAYFSLCALIAIVTRTVPALEIAQAPLMTFALSSKILRESVSVAENISKLGVGVFGIDRLLKKLLNELQLPATTATEKDPKEG
jgi:phage-related holin